MEKKLIEEWLKVEYDYGSGYGYGSGSGSGYSSGSGSGYGYGSGYGSGSGYSSGSGSGYSSGSGSVDGSGDGSGYGYGDGYGDGSGDGSGSGYSSGSGLKKYNEHHIFKVDGISTIITNIKRNVAKGYIVKQDLTLEKTWIAKGHNCFAHGSTLKEALQSLEEKIFSDLDTESKMLEFKKLFEKTKKYKGHEYFKWHNILTGSCLQGRKNFVQENNLDLEKEYTPLEFLEIVKGSFGWSVLKELVKDYK